MSSLKILDWRKESNLLDFKDFLEKLHFAPGEVIIREGEIGDSYFMLDSGTVHVWKNVDGNEDLDFGILNPGESFGEMALIDNEPRAATIKAETEAVLYKMTRHNFKSILEHSPHVAEFILRLMNQRFREAEVRTVKVLRKKNLELARANQELEEKVNNRTKELEETIKVNEKLLSSVLPPYAVKKLLQSQKEMVLDTYDRAGVLFTDIVGFTELSQMITPEKLIDVLNHIFSIFDVITTTYSLEKIKTIGDAYMLVGGLPGCGDNFEEDMANFAIDAIDTIHSMEFDVPKKLDVRVGFHFGRAIAGVIGIDKYAYDIWGDTVNIASRMESHGAPGQIHVSQDVYEKLKDKFTFESRGTIPVKGKGDMNTYFLTGRIE
ncbi:adenylate/guanylate cyclase domain-containing protein [Leptospira sp. GIMC2001]|uniref:adenylate/guanylate cyclase domain-containing protein n=1 Tax=Leptospira sp. GIMC2001 TaxID=1513297 RepID=UPI002349BEAD|nr:adenylate/guanylate cyclase domain-containing protein [Leptospira sp. GIMC2001]WCL48693.1 cyclic nucleotide-binding domain-containing protein [Leptospira sp. GIMC2001]